MASKMDKTPELPGALPPGPPPGALPLDPTGALKWVPGPHTVMLTRFAPSLIPPALEL